MKQEESAAGSSAKKSGGELNAPNYKLASFGSSQNTETKLRNETVTPLEQPMIQSP